jgi:hypothetical protein
MVIVVLHFLGPPFAIASGFWFVNSFLLSVHRTFSDYDVLRLGVQTDGLVRAYFCPQTTCTRGLAVLEVAYWVPGPPVARLVTSSYDAINPFRDWKPGDRVTIFYSRTAPKQIVVLKESPWIVCSPPLSG